MKRNVKLLLLSAILCAFSVCQICAQTVWDGVTIANGFGSGSGTKSNPYVIKTAPEFAFLIKQTCEGLTYKGFYFVLNNDISMGGYKLPSYTYYVRGDFEGTLDGQNHFIFDYTSDTPTNGSATMFYNLSGCVMNLGIEGNTHSHSGNTAIATYLKADGLIFHCYYILNNTWYGINNSAFAIYNYGQIVDCEVRGQVKADDYYNYYMYSNAAVTVHNKPTGKVIHNNYSSFAIKDGSYIDNWIVSYNYGTVDFGKVHTNYDAGIVTNTEYLWNSWVRLHPDLNYEPFKVTLNRTIQFKDNYGIVSYDAIIVESGDSLGNKLPIPEVDDCIFDGWRTSEGKKINSSTIISGNMILYANWKQKITEQPTLLNPTVTVSDSKHAKYQWYRTGTGVLTMPNWYSTNHSHSSTSSTNFSITGSTGGFMRFDWNVSSEDGYDKLIVSVNGSKILSKSGEMYGTYTYTFPSNGTYNVEIKYSKDGSESEGDDCASVENIVISSQAEMYLPTQTTKTLDMNEVTMYGFYKCKISYTNSDSILWSSPIEYSEAATLHDGDVYDNRVAKLLNTLTYNRTYNNTNWQALYVPFSMAYKDWKDNYDVAMINDINMYDTDADGEYDATELEIIMIKRGSLRPNHPYLIKAKSTGNKNLVIHNATLYPASDDCVLECSTAEMTCNFIGTYEGISGGAMYDNQYYALSGGMLGTVSNRNVSLKPYRWYMEMQRKDSQVILPQSYSTKIRIKCLDEETNDATDITEISDNKSNEDLIFSIDGRIINKEKENLHKGIYIKNGKKYIIK